MIKKYKNILIGMAVVIGLLFVLPFLIPMQTYLHEAEKIASEKLGAPVTIDSAHLYFLPSPRVVASGIAVGEHHELKVESLVIIPTIGSLLSATKIIDLTISKPVVNKAALEIVSAFTAKKTESSEAAAVNIRHIEVDELQLVWPDAKFPVTNVEVMLTDANKLQSALIETIDGKLKADITPEGDGHLIVASADKWTFPAGLPLLIDKAKVEMHLKGSRLEMPNIDVALYQGKLTGNAALSWQDNKGKANWRANGKLKVESLSMKEPTSMVSKSTYLSGHLFGNGNFSASAKEAAQLMDRLRADFRFNVKKGVLHGVDLIKAASLLLKQGQRGGETEFEEFSGLLNVSGKQYHLRELKISSGLLAAAGQIKISPKKELNGAVEVEVKRSVSLAAIPLEVSGTVSNPVVLPSKAALAGAVAGTAVLGPGVGTGLGVKAGGALDKLKGLFGDGK